MIEIPIFQNVSSNFTQEIILGGRIMNITLSWNVRCSCWFMELEDVQSGDSISGIKLVENWLMLRQFKASIPNFSGDFIIKKVNAPSEEITFDNLGIEFKLFFADDTEGDSWEAFYGLG